MVVEHEVQGAVVLVTGGGHGLGAATAEQFLRQGAKHVAILDVSLENGNKTADQLNEAFGEGSSEFIKCDVTKDEELFEAFDKVVENQGKLDVIVNNAGIVNESNEGFKKMIEINVTALISSTLRAIEMWRADKGGRGGTVINIASEVVRVQDTHLVIYGCTKAAVLHFSNCIGIGSRHEKTKVRVLTMCPGFSNTALFDDLTNKVVDDITSSEIEGFDIEKVGQSPSVVAEGIVEMYKHGESGSTWQVDDGQPAKDITDDINKRYSKALNAGLPK